jgi:2-polyprenyl-3-methyl-5-hydroxy-6-metoxy-1,4-benzoquinol methylase
VRSAPPYAIVRCRGCGLTYLSPRPSPEATERLYGPEYFENPRPGSPGYPSYRRLAAALEREALAKLAVVEAIVPPPARLLDHGCGTGVFLGVARRRGYEVFGIDVSAWAIETLRRERRLPAAHATLETGWGEDGSFDVVTSWDVLEHSPDPARTLGHIRRLLRPDGVLLLTTPDVAGVDARLLGRLWYGYTKIPEHYYFYSRDTLAALARNAGLEPVAFRRWGFVRDLAFVLHKLAALLRLPGAEGLADRLGGTALGRTFLSVPFVDMLAVARRPEEPAPARSSTIRLGEVRRDGTG